jgi:hypothetical protein
MWPWFVLVGLNLPGLAIKEVPFHFDPDFSISHVKPDLDGLLRGLEYARIGPAGHFVRYPR